MIRFSPAEVRGRLSLIAALTKQKAPACIGVGRGQVKDRRKHQAPGAAELAVVIQAKEELPESQRRSNDNPLKTTTDDHHSMLRALAGRRDSALQSALEGGAGARRFALIWTDYVRRVRAI